ncbi:MAG: hypothetical protein MUE90_08340 [Thermoanaerobaculales bacterium]|nr:hypothetical protein [Thermoanaerobaculales bacterium]
MERFDDVLEQLRQSRRRGFDSLAARLDEAVTALDRSLEAARSALVGALPADAEELLPLAEVEQVLAELPVPESRPAGVTLDDLRSLDRARTQSELLRSVLAMLGEHVGRAAILVIREGMITAWSGVGFGDGERLRRWQGGVAASPAVSRLVEALAPVIFSPADDPLLAGWLAAEGLPEEAVLLPIDLRGRLMGVVYLDHSGSEPWDLETAQALNTVACLLIDTLAHRAAVPSPTLAAIVEGTPRLEAVGEPEVFAAEPEETVQLDFGAEAAEEPGAEWREPVGEDEVQIDYDFEPEAAPDYEAVPEPAAPAFDPSATVQVEAAERATPVPPSVGELAAPPPVRPIAPPAVRPEAFAGAAPEDPRHEEARRFARLLVSEIKLYNEDEVERGRVERDLALRLKEDIDRSREMYEKRIPSEVRAGHDYFRDELVRILADGDPDALGR